MFSRGGGSSEEEAAKAADLDNSRHGGSIGKTATPAPEVPKDVDDEKAPAAAEEPKKKWFKCGDCGPCGHQILCAAWTLTVVRAAARPFPHCSLRLSVCDACVQPPSPCWRRASRKSTRPRPCMLHLHIVASHITYLGASCATFQRGAADLTRCHSCNDDKCMNLFLQPCLTIFGVIDQSLVNPGSFKLKLSSSILFERVCCVCSWICAANSLHGGWMG